MSDELSPEEHRTNLINQANDALQRGGWFESVEPFVLDTKTAELGYQAIFVAVDMLLRATHPYHGTWDDARAGSRQNSKLIVTLNAIREALRPVVHGENPKTLMYDSFARRNPQRRGAYNEGINLQIVAAMDCMVRHCQHVTRPAERLAEVLARWGVEKRGERTIRDLWNERPEHFAYDGADFATVFSIRLSKVAFANQSGINQAAIETALKQSVEQFQHLK